MIQYNLTFSSLFANVQNIFVQTKCIVDSSEYFNTNKFHFNTSFINFSLKKLLSDMYEEENCKMNFEESVTLPLKIVILPIQS